MLGPTLRSLLAAALAIAAGGCSTDETSSTTGDENLSPINITLSLANPSRCCAQVLAVPDTEHPFVLPIEVKVEGASASKFVLRPPGYCRFGGLTQCGHLVATVRRLDSQGSVVENVISKSSTTVIEVPLGGPGDVSIAVSVFDDDDINSLADVPPVTVSTQTSCPPLAADAPCPASSPSGDGMDGGLSDAGADGG